MTRKTAEDCDYCGKDAICYDIMILSNDLYSSYGVFLCERCWVNLKAYHKGRKKR